jgi:hypothetical protein
MKAYGEVDAKIKIFLIPVLDVEWSASGLGRFTHEEIIPYDYLINNYAMKDYWGVYVKIHVFLTPVIVSDWSDLGLECFTPTESSSYV